MTLKLYNTETRSVDELIPIEEGLIKMYCCGPTVYNYAHIGNLRTYIFEDVLRKTIKKAGYKIKHVMNVTDVGHLTSDEDTGEDKMSLAAKREQKDVLDIARFYEKAFFEDCAALNIERPDIVCRATEYIEEIIKFIQGLEAKGYVYVAGGNVYFDSAKFKDYGKMAHLDLENLRHGYRVEEDPNKKNPTDSVLWFTKSKYQNHILSWPSPWGEFGYPGWNIECSTMALKNLGERADIHCGGVDHINVHHTNEIAQSESLLGHKWINFWIHGEFLQLKNNEKMGKSKGNFLTVQVLKDEGYNPLYYRYLCLTSHYRSPLTFSFEALDAAGKAFEHLKEVVLKLRQEAGRDANLSKPATAYIETFNNCLFNDLNTAQALATLWTMLKDKELSAQTKLDALYDMDSVLSLGMKDFKEQSDEKTDLPDEVLALIEERKQARTEKNWAKSDELRDKLLKEYCLEIKDLAGGAYEVKKV